MGPLHMQHGLHPGAPSPRHLGGAAAVPLGDFRPSRKPPKAGPCGMGRSASALSAVLCVLCVPLFLSLKPQKNLVLSVFIGVHRCSSVVPCFFCIARGSN